MSTSGYNPPRDWSDTEITLSEHNPPTNWSDTSVKLKPAGGLRVPLPSSVAEAVEEPLPLSGYVIKPGVSTTEATTTVPESLSQIVHPSTSTAEGTSFDPTIHGVSNTISIGLSSVGATSIAPVIASSGAGVLSVSVSTAEGATQIVTMGVVLGVSPSVAEAVEEALPLSGYVIRPPTSNTKAATVEQSLARIVYPSTSTVEGTAIEQSLARIVYPSTSTVEGTTIEQSIGQIVYPSTSTVNAELQTVSIEVIVTAILRNVEWNETSTTSLNGFRDVGRVLIDHDNYPRQVEFDSTHIETLLAQSVNTETVFADTQYTQTLTYGFITQNLTDQVVRRTVTDPRLQYRLITARMERLLEEESNHRNLE